MIDRITNHKPSGITDRVYNKYDYLEEKREALDAWGAMLRELSRGLNSLRSPSAEGVTRTAYETEKEVSIMIYKGIVKGNVVELEKGVRLPEGTTVDVIVKGPDIEQIAPSGYPNGSPQAILAALDTPPHCTAEDVDAFTDAMEDGKPPIRFEGLFDREEEHP